MTGNPDRQTSLGRRITPIYPVRRRVLIISNSDCPGGDPYDRPGALADLIGGFDLWEVAAFEVADSGSNPRVFYQNIYNAIASVGTVQLAIVSSEWIWRKIAPALAIARYLGRSIAVHLDCDLSKQMSAGELRVFARVLRLADRITAGPTADIEWVRDTAFNVTRMVSAGRLERIESRVVSTVQPKVLCFVEPDQTGTAASMGRAIDLVKQKYPRAELVLATVGRSDLAFDCCETNRSGISCRVAQRASDIRALVEEADLLVDLSYSRRALPLQYGLAAGLPMVALRLENDIMLNDENAFLLETDDFVAVADTITAVVERPEAVERVSREALRSSRKWMAEPLKRQWVKHLESIRSPRM